jgi:hypothetical protein
MKHVEATSCGPHLECGPLMYYYNFLQEKAVEATKQKEDR